MHISGPDSAHKTDGKGGPGSALQGNGREQEIQHGWLYPGNLLTGKITGTGKIRGCYWSVQSPGVRERV